MKVRRSMPNTGLTRIKNADAQVRPFALFKKTSQLT